MKKKSKFANYLSLAFLGVASLTAACSGGGGTSNTSSGIQESEPIKFTDDDSVLNFAVVKLESYIASKVASTLFNEIFTGNPNNQPSPTAWTNKALSKINNSLSNIQSGLGSNQALITTLINDLQDIQIYQASQNLNNAVTNIQNAFQLPGNVPGEIPAWVNDIITYQATHSQLGAITAEELAALQNNFQNALINNESINQQVIDQIMAYYANPDNAGSIVSNPFPAIMSAGLNSNPQDYGGGDVYLDAYEQELSCDISPKLISWYTLESTVNAKNHPMPNLRTPGCSLINYLNTSLAYLYTKSISPGNNIFYTLSQFNYGLSFTALTIINALSQAYTIDQLRLFLYAQASNYKNLNIGWKDSLPAVISPANGKLKNYQEAKAELKLAYETRINFVMNLINQAESQAFGYYTTQISSTSMGNDCNLNLTSLLQLESNQLSQNASGATSNNGNLLSWDGQYLAVSCKNAQRYESGIFTSTTNVTGLCQATNSNYNLYSINGYVFCSSAFGQNIQESNYSNIPLITAGNNIPYYSLSPSSIPIPNSVFGQQFGGPLYDPMVYSIPSNTGLNARNPYGGPLSLNIQFSGTAFPIMWIYNPQQTNLTFGANGESVSMNLHVGPYTKDIPAALWTASGNAGWNKVSIDYQVGSCVDCDYTGTNLKPIEQNGWFIIFDGNHYFLMGAYVAYPGYDDVNSFVYNPFGSVYISCLNNDINCQQGIFANPNGAESSDYQALVFSNGDVITLTQNGRNQYFGLGGFGTGNYNLTQYYESACGPTSITNYQFSQSKVAPLWNNDSCTLGQQFELNGTCANSAINFAGYSGQTNSCQSN